MGASASDLSDSSQAGTPAPRHCEICGAAAELFAEATVLGKYRARYCRCSGCGFVFVPEPTWLPEAYAAPISRTDVGGVYRTVLNSAVTKSVIELCLQSADFHGVDYGAGYGMLVRRMRDLGYDFFGCDRFCPSLFAADFHLTSLANHHFTLATSYEVFEHLEHPLEVFAEIFSHADSLLLTTELFPENQPKPGEWAYYGLNHGQHVAFYSRRAFEQVARRFSKYYLNLGCTFHLFSARPVSRLRFKLARSQRFAHLYTALHNRPSLLMPDHDIAQRAVQNQRVN